MHGQMDGWIELRCGVTEGWMDKKKGGMGQMNDGRWWRARRDEEGEKEAAEERWKDGRPQQQASLY